MSLAIINAQIYVEADHFVSALLVEAGQIKQLGKDAEILALNPDQVIDGQGNTLLPGFNDSHLHLMMLAQVRQEVMLGGSQSIEEVLTRGRQFLAKHPDTQVLMGTGWNTSDFTSGEQRNLTRYDLDQISSDIPILFTRACGHTIAANTKAIEQAGLSSATAQPEGGRFDVDDAGPSGCFYENATDLIRPLMPVMNSQQMVQALRQIEAEAFSYGITSVHTNDIGLIRPLDEALSIYRDFYHTPGPHLKTYHQMCFERPEDFTDFIANEYQQPLPKGMRYGPLKLFKDGSFGGRSALLSQPYQGEANNLGVDVLPEAEAKQFLAIAREHQIPVTTHAIGDGAIRAMIELYLPHQAEQRWCINHFQISPPDIVSSMAKHHILANVQPVFLRSDVATFNKVLPDELVAEAYPWRRMLDQGMKLAISTDCPIEPFDPFTNLYWAITRKPPQSEAPAFYPDQALTLSEAIDAYTLGGAYLEFSEQSKGRLKPGYQADMVLLDRDIFSLDPEQLLETQVLMTFVDGEIGYQK